MKFSSSEPLYLHQPTRRAVLRGAGVTLALPFLESFKPVAHAAKTERPGVNEPPRRFAAMVFSNGVNIDHWWQKTDKGGRVNELGKTLQPLQPHLDDCLFLNNLHLFDHTSGVHDPYFSNFLTGVPIQRSSVPRLEQSIDQYMSKTVGRATPVPSIVLGIEPAGFGAAGTRPAIYRGTISWSSETTPIPPEIFPRQAFDRLFDTSSLIQDRSVLDFVFGEAQSIRSGLARHDQEKLDGYLESIREIEKRIELASSEERFEGWRPSLDKPNLPRPGAGTPHDIPEHMKLMLDLIVLAFQMDKTRVATMLFQRDLSNMLFDFLDGVGSTGLHNLSHHRLQTDWLEQYQITNAYHVQQLLYVIEKMKRIDEGNGTTLFDNTAILFGSTMADGNAHDGNRLRLLVAGGRAMGIQGGRSLHYDQLEDRRLCNLHLDLALRMGCEIEKFSNSHYPLPGVGA